MVASLTERFLEGEKLTIVQMTEECFKPNAGNPLESILARRKVQSWMGAIKKYLWKNHQMSFGNIDDDGRYGIPSTEEEVNYMNHLGYMLTKGIIRNQYHLQEDASGRKLLPSTTREENMSLPVFNEKK